MMSNSLPCFFWGLAKYADNYAEARSYFAQSLQICQRLNKVRGQFHSRFNQAGVARTVYDLATARTAYEEMLHLARKLNYRWGEAAVQFELGDIVRLQGEYTLALDLLGRGLRIFREVDDPLRQACIVATLTCLYSYLGATTLAGAWAEQFLDLTRGNKLPDAEEYGLPMLAVLAHHKGEHEQALHYAMHGLEKARAGGTLYWQARLLVISGHAEVGLGRMAAATDAYQQAMQIYQTIGIVPPAAEASAGLAHIALMQGDLAGAQTLVATILSMLDEHPRAGVDEPFLIYLTCYRVLAAGDDPRAASLLQRGYDLLHQYAEQIEDEALRRAFLENVATHRQLREAWERAHPA